MNKIFAVLSFALALFGCSSQVADTGSASGAGNPIIMGTALLPNGMPACSASVSVRPISYMHSDTARRFLGAGYDSLGLIYTDSLGNFKAEVTSEDDYRVEIIDRETEHSAVVYFKTKRNQISEHPQPIPLLMKTDTIRGVVTFHGTEKSAAKIYLLGTEKFTEIDSRGRFKLPVSEGVFAELRIVPASERFLPRNQTIHGNNDSVAVKILAKKPVSLDYECDSLIVRAILDTLGFRKVPIESVTETEAGRIVQLDIDDSLMAADTSIKITKLPAEITGLRALTDLEIQYTEITSLPEDIGVLSKIKELELQDNQLTSLPASIVNISPSEECVLGGNRLKNLPADIKAWADTYDSNWQASQR